MDKKIDFVTVGDIQTNCWLYSLDDDGSGGKPCIVIDPGDEADVIISRLRELNWVPHYIFLTHGHIDHLAALPELLAVYGKTYTGVELKLGIHSLDAHYLGKGSLEAHRYSFSASGGNVAYVDAIWKPMPEADLFYEEGSTAGSFTVLHVPGHTQGSVALYDEKTGALFSGDTLFKGTWGRTDLPGGNEEQLHQSLKRLLSMNREIVVCPGHGPPTTIGEEIGLLAEF